MARKPQFYNLVFVTIAFLFLCTTIITADQCSDGECKPQSQGLFGIGHFTEQQCTNLVQRLLPIHRALNEIETQFATELAGIHPNFTMSARNLLQYMALRHHDISQLQDTLASMGLSSLGRAEAHVQHSITNVIHLLTSFVCSNFAHMDPEQLVVNSFVSYEDGKRLLEQHTDALFGSPSPFRHTRIMVTMPAEAGENYTLVKELVAGGMEIMRINCAHDDPLVWRNMYENLQKANQELGTHCKVLMDLGGPKLRTGIVSPGPKVVKIKPQRDVMGNVVQPAKVWMTSEETPQAPPSKAKAVLPMPPMWLQQLRIDDELEVKDTRGKRRTFHVEMRVGDSFWVTTEETSYITTGSVFKIADRKTKYKGRVGDLPSVDIPINLKAGDTVIVTRDQTPGQGAIVSAAGKVLEPARIPCSLPEIFTQVKSGESIWFDDGKIGGVINSVEFDQMSVNITHAEPAGSNLASDKGINLPQSDLRLPSLTAQDIMDLEYVVNYTDLIGLSFVDDPSDVNMLHEELLKRGKPNIPVILKIETRRAFERLPSILLAAMKGFPLGVMIARGDLAVECGYTLLAELQEEILWITEAAHVPVIWATQVLETMAKKGTPTRAEITDAAMSARAECVMLNKGPYILETVHLLDDVLRRMQSHQTKKTSKLQHLEISDVLFDLHA